jgi:anti-sigma B factor antagonist
MPSGAEGRAMGPTLCVCPGGSGAIVRIEGEIDVCVADRLRELLLLIMRAHGPRLLLDLSAVSFIDCAGLRAVLLPVRHAELRDWSVRLIAASAMIRKMITLTGMEGVLPIGDQDQDGGACAAGQPEHPAYYMIDPSWIQRTGLGAGGDHRGMTYRDE